MKFLSVRDLRGKSTQVWKELPGGVRVEIGTHPIYKK